MSTQRHHHCCRCHTLFALLAIVTVLWISEWIGRLNADEHIRQHHHSHHGTSDVRGERARP